MTGPAALVCPECGLGQDHPPPFQDVAGNWICGKCWFIDQIETIMEVVEAPGSWRRAQRRLPTSPPCRGITGPE